MARPALFLSHGAPSLLTGQSAARDFLIRLGEIRPSPAAYVVVSAHFESAPVAVTSAHRPATVHDFRGFSEALHSYDWPAPGAPEQAEALVTQLNAAGIDAVPDAHRGFDHGVWVPLALMEPDASIPVLQVSLPGRHSTDTDSWRLGRALAPLSEDNIQLVFSGSLTHSLRDALAAPEDAPPAPFAREFADWARQAMAAGHWSELMNWTAAPQARRNHPSPEHFRPLLAAAGAASGPGEQLHESYTHAALAMDVWSIPV